MSAPHEAFEVHPRLAADCAELGALVLCRVLLMNDARFPWLILVPQRAGISEIHQLVDADQLRLIRESSRVARAMTELFHADKMNVAALGNVVPQLHLHHVARRVGDAAWPGPVWGAGTPEPYAESALAPRIELCRAALGLAQPKR